MVDTPRAHQRERITFFANYPPDGEPFLEQAVFAAGAADRIVGVGTLQHPFEVRDVAAAPCPAPVGYVFTQGQINTILAALRYWQVLQETSIPAHGDRLDAIIELAGEGMEMATSEDIDDLCEAINEGPAGATSGSVVEVHHGDDYSELTIVKSGTVLMAQYLDDEDRAAVDHVARLTNAAGEEGCADDPDPWPHIGTLARMTIPADGVEDEEKADRALIDRDDETICSDADALYETIRWARDLMTKVEAAR